MEKVFVKATFEIHCDWEGLPPVYRVFVNDELFTERTWRWTEEYLEEMLQILAEPGMYKIKFDALEPCLAKFSISNHQILCGSAQWHKGNKLEILNAST